jgi:hypothetical protein
MQILPSHKSSHCSGYGASAYQLGESAFRLFAVDARIPHPFTDWYLAYVGLATGISRWALAQGSDENRTLARAG